ncbi:hypothetical protein Taro_033140 [Colocasia esculenta]|uniref:Uncharacterized protein n=1 Tax=Colocasia esculenta TaxID=4460 RepID=A0A843W624_COLES|nr:hypothetical protein [Colocasia esculenta]
MFNPTRDLLPRSWIWVPEHRRYSHPLRFIPTPSAKELGITFRMGIGNDYVTTIRNRHSETVDRVLVSRNSVLGPKFAPGASDSLDYANRWRSSHAEPPSHSDRKSCSTRGEISSLGHGYVCLNIADIRLPRLRKSLAEPTRGAAQSQRSEVVFNPTQDLVPRSWIWVPKHRRYSHPLQFIPTPSAEELGINFRMGIENAYVTTIRNRDSETVDRVMVSRNSVLGPKFAPGASDSLDYANGWQSPHAEPTRHSDRKSCSTRRVISSPAKELGITFRMGIGIAYVSTIRNRHSETADRVLVSRNSIPGTKFASGACNLPRLRESLADPTRGAAQSQQSEVVFNSTRDLLPRSWIWVPEHRRYSHTLWFIPTPSAKELGITFRTGIGIACVTTIRNRHSETVDRALVLRNSVPGPKFTPGACVLVHDCLLKLDPTTCCIEELAGSSRKASPTSDCTGACSRTQRKAIFEAGVVGDEALVEETLETDSERGD